MWTGKNLWVRNDIGLLYFIMSGNYPASERNVGGSTQVPGCVWYNVWSVTQGLPPVKAWKSLYDLSSDSATYNKTKQTKKNII